MTEYRFLKACRREPVDVTPVWIMRQRAATPRVPEDPREQFVPHDVQDPRTGRAGHPPAGRAAGRGRGDPLLRHPHPGRGDGGAARVPRREGAPAGKAIRGQKDVDSLTVPDPGEKVPFVMEAIRILRKELDGKVPLIGFSGAPFTLASYIVEGGPRRTSSS